MTDEIKIPEEIKEEAENLQELVEDEMADTEEAAEEVIETVEAEVVEAEPSVIEKAQEELKAVQEEAAEAASAVEESEVMKIADKVEFTPEEMAIIAKYANEVDLKDTNCVLQFGADAQEKLAEFSESALTNVRTSDLGTIGDSLSGLVTELRGFSATEERHGLAKLFHKALDPIEEMKNRYDKANNNVEKVVNILEGHQVTLTKDIAVLDELFNANTENFKNLSMYIAAGKKALKEARDVTLPAMKQKAEETKDQGDLQAATDYASRMIRYGLLTREEGFKLIDEHDGNLDPRCVREFCQFLGYSVREFWAIIDKLYNKDIFEKDSCEKWVLKKFER